MKNIDLLLEEFEKALLQINRIGAAEIFEKCYTLENRFDQLEQLAIQSLEKIGAGWENGTVSLSQVYMGGGIICEELIDKYLPKMLIKRKDGHCSTSGPPCPWKKNRLFHSSGRGF